jgi:hypothetical protein
MHHMMAEDPLLALCAHDTACSLPQALALQHTFLLALGALQESSLTQLRVCDLHYTAKNTSGSVHVLLLVLLVDTAGAAA